MIVEPGEKELPQCSNRTFMELKYVRKYTGQAADEGSNRTFMELKCTMLADCLPTPTF